MSRAGVVGFAVGGVAGLALVSWSMWNGKDADLKARLT